jgi:hypothetical protein
MSLKNGKHSNLSRKIGIIHIILPHSVPPGLSSFLYPLSLSVKEKGLALADGVATFDDVIGISCGPGLSSGLWSLFIESAIPITFALRWPNEMRNM